MYFNKSSVKKTNIFKTKIIMIKNDYNCNIVIEYLFKYSLKYNYLCIVSEFKYKSHNFFTMVAKLFCKINCGFYWF